MILSIVKPLWHYRHFIAGSVIRDFQSRYRLTLLGAGWVVIQPLAMILVYTLIFSQVMQSRLPGLDSGFGYSIYLCAGLISWGLFAQIINRQQNLFAENATLIKKLQFPRLCLPIIAVLIALLDFLIIFGLFCLFLLYIGEFPGWLALWLLPILMVMMLFATGLGFIVAILNVFFRDTGQLMQVVMQFWFWLTPIVYPVTILPEGVQAALRFNPMTPLIQALQSVLVYQQAPQWQGLVVMLIIGVSLCLAGLLLFRRHGHEIVDEL